MRDEVRELAFLLRSRFPVLAVETAEEPRFLAVVERAANLEDLPLYVWSVVAGLERRNRPETASDTHELQRALLHIRSRPQNGVFVFLDAQPFVEDPVCVRLVRELAMAYNQVARTLVFVGSRVALPQDVLRMSATFQLALPGVDEIRDLFREEIGFWKSANDGRALRGDQRAYDLLVQHLVGFTRDDARRLVRQSIESEGAITMDAVARVLKHKHEALASSSVLSLEMDTATAADVGGQVALKHWLSLRRGAFLGEPGTESLRVPRGVLLLGVQGSGKSLAAKAIAGGWQVPLLRLDVGALYNKFSGETERNLRESLKTAQAMAPCILWLDEIEKGLASGDGSGDEGVSRRVLGSFLTWMSERRERVFIVATANDVTRVPAELMRKGRFDEVFFVDLPKPDARADIFAIHLRKRSLDPARIDVAALAARTDGYSGAEIEEVIVSAQYAAHAAREETDTARILAEIDRTKPLSVVRAEEVESLREWALQRCVRAN